MKVKTKYKNWIFGLKLSFSLLLVFLLLGVSLTGVQAGHADEKTMGSLDAPVTMIEYADFECPFCARYFDQTFGLIKENYIDTGLVRYEFRHFPLSFHLEAENAALASECAAEQGEFWEYHDLLFENQEYLSRASYIEWAGELGLDVGDFTSCYDSERYLDLVEDDFDGGQAIGVQGTPAFFVDGEQIAGAQPYYVYEDVIEAALEDVPIMSCSRPMVLQEGDSAYFSYCSEEEDLCWSNFRVTAHVVGYDSLRDENYVEISSSRTSTLIDDFDRYYEGDTQEMFLLGDGVDLKILDIVSQEFAGGVRNVEICFDGAEYLGDEFAGTLVVESMVVVETEPTVVVETIEPEVVVETYVYEEEHYDLSDYPEIFIDGGDFDAIVVIGAKASSEESLAASILLERISDDGLDISDGVYLDSELNFDSMLDENLIIIGTEESNTFVSEFSYYLHSYGSYSIDLFEGEAQLTLLKGGEGNYVLLIVGEDSITTRDAAEYLAYAAYELEGIGSTIVYQNGELTVLREQVDKLLSHLLLEGESTTPTFDVTPEIETVSEASVVFVTEETEASCAGCLEGDVCLPFGTRTLVDELPMYCAIDGELHEQTTVAASCQNNYECLSNQCSNGQCVDLYGELQKTNTFLEKISSWFRSVFGS